MTLRAKLALSVACAIALSIALTLFLTWKKVSSAILSSEEAHFSSIAKSVENNLESSYQEYLAAKVRVVMDAKHLMRSTAINARNDIFIVESSLPISPLRNNLLNLLINNHDTELAPLLSENVVVDLVTVGELRHKGFTPLHVGENMLNVKEQTISEMLISLPHEGEFGLWQDKDGVSKLLFILPIDNDAFGRGIVDSDRILICGIVLRKLFHEADAILRNRLNATRINFENLDLYERGCIFLRSTQGEILIQRGKYTPLVNELDELYKTALQNGNAIGQIATEDGEYLCHVSWIQAYHWYFIMAAPVEVLREPSSAVVSKLLLAGLLILIGAALLTSLLVVRFMRPLHELRDCTSELASVDPSSASSLASMEQVLSEKLNISRHDELGDLARSFSSMGRELIKNIRTSIDAMTAQKRMEGELSAARDIQMGILPDLQAQHLEKGFSIAAFLEPAREVGGDLYDCFTLSHDRKVLALGDVSGKGVPAALFMTMTMTLLRSTLHSGLEPAEAIKQINHLLEEHNPGNMFVTLFLAVYQPSTGELVYANGGHCLPYILSRNGQIRQLEHLSGPLVGVMPGIDYLQFKDTLAPDERFFLYTDGLTEAMNADKEFYGDQRLEACLSAHAQDTPEQLHEAVFNDICAFRGSEPPSDDITMMTICRTTEKTVNQESQADQRKNDQPTA